MEVLETRVLIIGGGATGTGLARDLALRGVKTLLVEKGDINAGASGGNHGLLHSGARYVASDLEAAVECREEGEILKRLAPQCIEDTGGLFVAVEGDDEAYADKFPSMCDESGIEYERLTPDQARSLEPVLSPKTTMAYQVQDASVDPFMLSLDNLNQSLELGGGARINSRAESFNIKNGKIESVEFHDAATGQRFQVRAEVVVNAAGAWAAEVAEMAGAHIHILYSSGSLLVTQDRISRRVINRLRKASDADILVPGGTVSILGTTSVTIESPDLCRPTVAEADMIIDDAKAMIPSLETTRYIRAYAGVRPLVFEGGEGEARSVSRGFSLIDHSRDQVDNFVTITGGKLTTYRLMAEKTADMVCAKLGVDAPCVTRTEPLPASADGRWTEPGRAPKYWIKESDPNDLLLCECEMVPMSVVDEVVEKTATLQEKSRLVGLGLRTRVGKGPCQGAMCGLRVTSHLYDREHLSGGQGTRELDMFINERWKGFSPICWGSPMIQADLQEALYCGLLDMDLAIAKAREADGERKDGQ